MGHFPHVHTGILGKEPHTEVKEYDVDISLERDEIRATRCPSSADGGAHRHFGAELENVYRVPPPYCSVLYKSCPMDEARMDVAAILAQPLTAESIRVHLLLVMIDDVNDTTTIPADDFRAGQANPGKPVSKRLPLDPRAETSIRADKSAIVYRRWLSQKGINYGVIPYAA